MNIIKIASCSYHANVISVRWEPHPSRGPKFKGYKDVSVTQIHLWARVQEISFLQLLKSWETHYNFFYKKKKKKNILCLFGKFLGVIGRGVQKTCQPTKPNLTRPNLTRWVGSVFRAWWVGLQKIILQRIGLGLDHKITNSSNPI